MHTVCTIAERFLFFQTKNGTRCTCTFTNTIMGSLALEGPVIQGTVDLIIIAYAINSFLRADYADEWQQQLQRVAKRKPTSEQRQHLAAP
jgi:hypothetical protein